MQWSKNFNSSTSKLLDTIIKTYKNTSKFNLTWSPVPAKCKHTGRRGSVGQVLGSRI